MTVLHRNKAGNSQRGVALILALLVLLVVGAVGIGMVFMANTETNISSNFRDEQTAFFAARAGLEEVRDRSRAAAPNSLNGSLPAALPGANNGVLYITNPTGTETVAPWDTGGNNYPDTEICQEVPCTGGVPTGTPWYTTASAGANYAATPTLVWKWARVTWKTNKTSSTSDMSSVDGTTNGNGVCWNGSNEITTTSPSCPGNSLPVYEVTALAIAPGGSRRMVQSELTTIVYPPLPGGLTFDGPNANFSSPNSNPFHINGQDQASPACPPAGDKPAIAGYDDASVVTLTDSLNRPDHYSGVPPGGSTPVAPSVSNTGPSATPPANTLGVLGTVSGLQGLVNSITGVADQIVPSGGTPPLGLGTASNPLVTVIQGDFSASGAVHGYGVLLVEGNATFSGNFSWDGEILVIGNGNLTANGGGNGRINGGVLVANINSGVIGNTPGPPTVTWNGGGGNGIYYDSCQANMLNNRGSYFRTIAARELMR